MPVYEFHCESCERDFEELVRASGRDEVKCPRCGGHDVARRVSVFAARSGVVAASQTASPGGCGRCGDPNGPCGLP